MSKKKNSVALFEVIQKTDEKDHEPVLGVPGWMNGKPEQPPEEHPQPPEHPEPDVLSQSLPRPAGISGGPFSRPEEPVVSRLQKRVRLSLSPVAAAAVSAALLALLALAFLLGRWTKPSRPAEPASKTSVKAGLASPDKPKEKPHQPPTKREKGKHYLIIQNLGVGLDANGRLTAKGKALKAQADDIVKFCRKHDKYATVNTWRGKYLIVWSLSGVDSPAGDEAKNSKKEIEALGRRYLRSGGRWDFKSPTFLTQH